MISLEGLYWNPKQEDMQVFKEEIERSNKTRKWEWNDEFWLDYFVNLKN